MSKRMRSLLVIAEKAQDVIEEIVGNQIVERPTSLGIRANNVCNNAMHDWALHYDFLLKYGRYLEDEVA